MSKTFLNERTAKIIETLHNVFNELSIDAYIIGAQARDIWFFPLRNPRVTRDIDWVIADSNENLFKELKSILVEREGFRETPNPLRLLTPDNIEIDLLPFDHPEIPHFLGFHEIFERGTEDFIFDNGKTYQVATLPAVVLLKLIAWNNRPEKRGKDIEDITYILKHFDIYTDDGFILFTEIEPEFISARIIGRKINQIIGNSTDLKNHIISILENHIENPDTSKIIKIMVSQTEESNDFALQQLKELLIGIKET